MGRPSGSCTPAVRRSPPRASSRTSAVPSPPSAAGQRSGIPPASSTPRPMASATCRALRVPLNESGATRNLGVEGVDFLLVLLSDDVPLHLQGGCQLAALLGEVLGQDLEFLHLLDAGELLVDLVEMFLEHLPHPIVLGELGGVGGPALLLRELGALLRI